MVWEIRVSILTKELISCGNARKMDQQIIWGVNYDWMSYVSCTAVSSRVHLKYSNYLIRILEPFTMLEQTNQRFVRNKMI